MLFNSNDYTLDKEYRTRMMRQAHQDHLAEEVRTNPVGKVVMRKRRIVLATGAFVVVTIFFVILQYGLV